RQELPNSTRIGCHDPRQGQHKFVRTLLYILQKEFLQIFRNRAMLPIIFVMPVIQLIILGNAATFEIRRIEMAVVDLDRSPTSHRLIDKVAASGRFVIVAHDLSRHSADDVLLRGDADVVMEIPQHFERDLTVLNAARVQLVLDAQDGATAAVANSYATAILNDFDRQVGIERAAQTTSLVEGRVRVVPASWYNPNLDYQTYMVPGILVILVTMIGTFLSAMNVVREKEIGTIEQLNVTPMKRYHFIAGKLLPLLIIALGELAIGLVIARLLFDVPIVGSVTLIFLLAAVYLLVMVGFGLWISTFTHTQQQAMFLAWFFIVVFILMSGLFTPIESMPRWAQDLTLLNPVAYFIKIMRRVMLKGAGFDAVATEFWSLLIYAAGMLSLAVSQYRKVTA
ncbi:MAG: ABC transporter permease, partial [Rhodothermales bacterium]|nr:ABC transporter permease [Rhodothermales bacterium]